MGVTNQSFYLPLSFYYSDETEDMAVDIPEDILDQDDTDLILRQPIMPVSMLHPPPTPVCQPPLSAFQLLESTVHSLGSAALPHVSSPLQQVLSALQQVSAAPAAPQLVSAAPLPTSVDGHLKASFSGSSRIRRFHSFSTAVTIITISIFVDFTINVTLNFLSIF